MTSPTHRPPRVVGPPPGRRSHARNRHRSRNQHRERGATTAEYAVGTLGACTVAGVLFQLGASDWFVDIFEQLIGGALDPGVILDLLRPDRPYVRLR